MGKVKLLMALFPPYSLEGRHCFNVFKHEISITENSVCLDRHRNGKYYHVCIAEASIGGWKLYNNVFKRWKRPL